MEPTEAAEWLDLVVEYAPRLRAVGVKACSFGEIDLELEPADVVFQSGDDDRNDRGDIVEKLPLPTLERRR